MRSASLEAFKARSVVAFQLIQVRQIRFDGGAARIVGSEYAGLDLQGFVQVLLRLGILAAAG